MEVVSVYYFGKTVVFILEDEDVKAEVDRMISEDELEFNHYVSKLVEEDISRKLGKKTYISSQIIETENNSLTDNKVPETLSDIVDKLYAVMSMVEGRNVTNNPAMQNNYVQQSIPRRNESLTVEVPSESIKEVVQEPVKSEPSVASTKPKAKGKKKKMGVKGLDKGSLLSKMQSMQK